MSGRAWFYGLAFAAVLWALLLVGGFAAMKGLK